MRCDDLSTGSKPVATGSHSPLLRRNPWVGSRVPLVACPPVLRMPAPVLVDKPPVARGSPPLPPCFRLPFTYAPPFQGGVGGGSSSASPRSSRATLNPRETGRTFGNEE